MAEPTAIWHGSHDAFLTARKYKEAVAAAAKECAELLRSRGVTNTPVSGQGPHGEAKSPHGGAENPAVRSRTSMAGPTAPAAGQCSTKRGPTKLQSPAKA